MPGSFVKFLLSEASDQYVIAALKDMKESPDRYTNALQTIPTSLIVPYCNSLANNYKKLLSFSCHKKRIHRFTKKLLEIACTELLDQYGNLHPVIIRRFKIEETHTALRNSFLHGFVHHILRELLNTDILKSYLSKKDLSESDIFIHLKNTADSGIRNYLTHKKNLNLIVHQHVMKQEVFSTVGYDETFIILVRSDPNFLKHENLSAYIQATSLKLLTLIKMAVQNIADAGYIANMNKIINEMAENISTIGFSKIVTDIQDMEKMTRIANSNTEKGRIFCFFKPTNKFILTINKHLGLLFYILNILHNNCHTARLTGRRI